MAADKRAARLGVLGLVAVLLFGALGTRLWFLQTVEAESLQETVDLTRTVTRQIAPERGRIFDADGRVLADNRGSLAVKLDWSSMRRDTDRAALFTRLSPWLEMPVEEMEARYDSGRYSRYEPMPIKEDVSRDVALALRERIEDFPGLIVDTEWERVYPYAPLASHVIGYMGSITEEDEDKYEDLGYDTSSQGERVGRAGVEASMEEVLHGQWGEVAYEIDSSNRIVREISYTPPVNGRDIRLTIDLDLQQYAERLLYTQLTLRRAFTAENAEVRKPDGTRGPQDPDRPVGAQVPFKAPAGSITVMNQNTGQVLAMASYPTFDNRWFGADIDDEKFNEIFPTENPDGSRLDPDLSALPNRAIQGQYNMGSAFKVFTAYAALRTGMLSPDTVFDDQGTYTIKSIDPARCQDNGGSVRCTYRNSNCNGVPCEYGPVNLQQSLAVSSDTFYYALGDQFYESHGTAFQDQLAQLGFGRDPGIDLPFAWDGRVPSNEVKAALIESGALSEDEVPNLTPGDLLQTAIGQGLMAATPLQMAVGYAAVANGGQVVTPHVVQTIYSPGVPNSTEQAKADLAGGTVIEQVAPESREIPMPDSVRGPIIAGLRQNITGPGANGRSTTAEELFADYPEAAIQVAGKTGTAQGYQQYPWNDSSAFAAVSLDPEKPFTIVSYLEKAGFGSTGAAPAVKCMYLALSGLPVDQGGVVVDPVAVSDPLDLTSTVPAQNPPEVYVTDCMRSSNPGTIRPD